MTSGRGLGNRLAVAVTLLAVGGCAETWPIGRRTPLGTATLVLEWRRPTADLELTYGVGDPESRASGRTFRRSFWNASAGRPARLELPLPTGAGKLWYGFRDIDRPSEVYFIQHRHYQCRSGGRLRIEIDAAKKLHEADVTKLRDGEYDETHWYVGFEQTLWQEGCSVPDYALGLTPPAVATVKARWSNPRQGTRLWVFTNRRHKSLLHKEQFSSGAVPMPSGPGTLWLDFSDAAEQVWEVQSQPFVCADGGLLDVEVDAAIVDDTPSIRLKSTGRNCRPTGPPVSHCGSGKRHPNQHRSEAKCWPELPPSDCCVSVPDEPGED